jgi:hypothetical protein
MEGTTMTVVANLTVKMPRMRLRMARLAIFALAPFIRSEAKGQRIGVALIAWVQRGLRVSVT